MSITDEQLEFLFDKAVSDPIFRASIEEDPLTALSTLGIHLNAKDVYKIATYKSKKQIKGEAFFVCVTIECESSEK